MILSAILSAGGLSGYIFPLNTIFAMAAAVVIFVEAFFVWWISTREGKKAMV